MTMIYWRDVPYNAKIRLVGSKGLQSYKYGNKTIYWEGREYEHAEYELRNRIRKQRAYNPPTLDKKPLGTYHVR